MKRFCALSGVRFGAILYFSARNLKWGALKQPKENSDYGHFYAKQKNAAVFTAAFSNYGGLEGDRTLDLTDANRTLSQLSYEPICDC